jgi:hypothetical protein
MAAGVIDPQLLKTKHCQTDAEDLSGAKVSVCLLGFAEVGVKRRHFRKFQGCKVSKFQQTGNVETLKH